MSYLKYQDAMAELIGKPVDKEVREKLWKENGITSKDFHFKVEGADWDATVYYQHGKPIRMDYYIWTCTDESWEEAKKEILGDDFKFENGSGGNGHYSTDIVRK